MFRRVALFYSFRRKRVFIAMGGGNVDFVTLHLHSDFNEIPPGLPGGPQGVPGRLLSFPWRPQGRPWGPQERPQAPPGRSGDPFETTVGSPRPPQERPRTLFERPRLSWTSPGHFLHDPGCSRLSFLRNNAKNHWAFVSLTGTNIFC